MHNRLRGQLFVAFLAGLVGGTWVIEMLSIPGWPPLAVSRPSGDPPPLHPLLVAAWQVLVCAVGSLSLSSAPTQPAAVAQRDYLHDAV